MNSRLLLLSIISFGLLLISACSPAAKQVEVSCDDFMNQKHISEQIEIASGSLLKVTLCSNPTTGFQWEEAQISNEAVVKQVDRAKGI